MKIDSFCIRQFQSYAEAQTVKLDRHVTVVAGRNNVGKSALLRALQLPTRPQEGGHSGLRVTYCMDLADVTALEAAFPAGDATNGRANVDALEWLTSKGQPVRVEADFLQLGPLAPTDPQQLLLAALRLPAHEAYTEGELGSALGWANGPYQGGRFGLSAIESLVRIVASRTVFLGPRKIDQGRTHLAATRDLEPDARNLTSVLLHLQLNDLDVFGEVRSIMQNAFPDIRDVSVGTEGSSQGALMGEPMLYFHGRETPIPLRLCGSGLEQMLALAVGVLSARLPMLFLIDEPQAYLHPHAERSLLALLDQNRQHQYVVASHSHVMLRSRPLSHARLVYLEGGESRIAHETDDDQVLSELGVTASDLWLSDNVLWVEGPTEEEVLRAIATHYFAYAEVASLTIRRMPQAVSRFVGGRQQSMEAAYRFCTDTSRAIAPVPIRMHFLFDRDEKTPSDLARLDEASGGTSRVLSVRETENLFLDAELLQRGIASRIAVLERDGVEDLTTPSVIDVAAELDALLQEVDDVNLFPNGLSESLDPLAAVKGSEVLSRIWWSSLTSPYDKPRDGSALTAVALNHRPQVLEPLVAVLAEVIGHTPAGPQL
jgi:hypothetical protein